jgi:hypothetical protein
VATWPGFGVLELANGVKENADKNNASINVKKYFIVTL